MWFRLVQLRYLTRTENCPTAWTEKRVVLYGIDESYLTMNSTGAAEGRFPQGMGEIMLSSNAARVLQVAVGDTVTLRTPSGDWDFTVSGLGGVEESFYSGQYSLMDAYLPRTAFAALMEQNNVHNLQTSYYVQFTSASKAAKAIPELTAQLTCWKMLSQKTPV